MLMLNEQQFVICFQTCTTSPKMFKQLIWLLVRQNYHTNIISRCVYISVAQDMVLKTPYRANTCYKNSLKCRKILIYFGSYTMITLFISIGIYYCITFEQQNDGTKLKTETFAVSYIYKCFAFPAQLIYHIIKFDI